MIDLGYDIDRCRKGLDAATKMRDWNREPENQVSSRVAYWEAQLAHARRRESGEGMPVPETPAPVAEEVSRYPVVYDRVGDLMGIAAGPWRVLMQGASEEQIKRIAYLVDNDKEFPL